MAAAAGSQPRWRSSIRHLGLTAAVVTTAIAAVTVAGTARQEHATSFVRHLPAWLLVLGLIGTASVTFAAWAVWAHHPHGAIGLAAIAGGAFLPLWAGWPGWWSGARAAVLAAPPLVVAGAAHLALRWRADSHRTGLLAVVYTLTAGAVGVHILGYDPFADPDCRRTCIRVQPLARDVIDTRAAANIAFLLTIVAALLVALALLRTRPATAPRPILGGTLGALALSAGTAAIRWVRWGDRPPSDAALVLSPFAITTLTGATVLFVAVNTRRSRAAVERLIAQLSGPGWRAVGGAIGGVHFAVPGDGRWVDPDGHSVNLQPEPRRCVVMSDESGPVVRLLLTGDKEAIDVLDGLTPAMRLSLRNAQLAAVTRARLADVQASRRRIVATSDAERERIEHDLHDGAQQRLVSAAFYLSVARGQLPEHHVPVERAETHVREALAHLRRVAHGIFPSVLATEGLHATLDELVRSTDVPATLDVSGNDDVDAEIAMAAYATVVTALDLAERTSPGECARITVERCDECLNVSVEAATAPGVPAAVDFIDLADRVGALGGRLAVSSTDRRTVVTAVLPCAS